MKTQIVLQARDVKTNNIGSEEVDSLKTQLAEMQTMMAQMMANQNSQVNTTVENKIENKVEEETPAKKSAGRPSTKNK